MKHILGQHPAIHRERAHHDRVHKHPAEKRRRGALVQPTDALITHRLQHTLQRAAEPCRIRRLQPNLDGIKRMANYKYY